MTLPTDYQTFIHKSRYAKWLDEEGRREDWEETVIRYIDNVVKREGIDDETEYSLYAAILDLDVMPSMRALMTAGKAFDRDNTCGYNCAYLPVNSPRAFDEAMHILLCGTGVGFSVERDEIDQLPTVPVLSASVMNEPVVVADSKEGWARAYKEVLSLLWSGLVPIWDVSKVRPSGAKLKTFGGRASGPAPLVDLFNFTVETFKGAQGRKLTDLECHDMMCKVGTTVVVGGVRRSAMISLSNLSSNRMATAKSGDWFNKETGSPWRGVSNNSVAYTQKPDVKAFMSEWLNLMESGSGERGIFNREASQRQAGKNGRRFTDYNFGTNPCSEIILRPNQFCNLTEVVVRAGDTIEDLERKVELATILGTIQSTYTNFPYLRKVWQRNTEDERLLGVSLTGIYDNPLMTTANKGLEKTLDHLKQVAISTNDEWAKRLGVPSSTAITCVKPSGTVSQLVDSSSGIHARYSKHYIRTVRANVDDPMTAFMQDAGIPNEPEAFEPNKTVVFSFPVSAPKGAKVTKDVTALQQLEMWLMYQRHWCEHKPSVTISVRADEWMEVGAFVYKHFDEMSGVSFLPFEEHTYQQAPYQECAWLDVVAMRKEMPKEIDWTKLTEFEQEDHTAGSQTFACTGDSCEIVDIT